MAKKFGKLVALASVASLLALSLSACSNGSVTPSPTDGNSEPGESFELEAAWLAGGNVIALVTWGSSNCIPTPSAVNAVGVNEMSIALEPVPADRPCTRDYMPQVNVIDVPTDLDRQDPVTVKVKYLDAESTAQLAALDDYVPNEGIEFENSAGWASEDAAVLVTYGSSSCQPVIESVGRDADGNVSLKFVDGDPNQPCTSDLAPRFTYIGGIPAGETTGVSLLINGDNFENVTVPILP